MNSISRLPPFERKSGELNVVIDTPKGSRNKFSWDKKRQLFELGGVLPSGAVFPFDFGFIPNTIGEDRDALDVFVLMDEPAFTGCLVHCRLLGVIEAEQTEKGETKRNDRLIARAAKSRTHSDLKSISDLNLNLLDEIEHFFVSYNTAKGKSSSRSVDTGPNALTDSCSAHNAGNAPEPYAGSRSSITSQRTWRRSLCAS